MNKVITSPNAPAAVGPYSQAIQAGGTIYVSGQLPVDPATKTVADTIEEQTAQSLINTKSILNAAGYDFCDVVKSTVLLADMNDFAAMNGVYAKFYSEPFPARVAYQVVKLPLGVKVEIETIAYKG